MTPAPKRVVMYYVSWTAGHGGVSYKFFKTRKAAVNKANREGAPWPTEVHVPTDPKGLRDFLNILVIPTDFGHFEGLLFHPKNKGGGQ